ncbi:NAD-dependent epimerase/dehydratase family protein [Halosquirtibacter xylanolyticus]|uniref:NAD-dependent epimerase/dehydratase family protein n=1 Tax=Halosquirtibacter xylanolyticus TaxID=3374599 RepID=UPI003749AC04|nr:NAD-dependent epimerase/dehydratase family protein [Prolixibacteraceae bacterium]
MRSIFITGVNGLLGTNLVHLLLDKGYRVIGLVRSLESYKGKTHDNLELVTGTLFDDYSKILQEVDYVVHIAAVTSQNIISESYYWKINTDATKQLFYASKICKVKKFIFVSSANTIGFGSLDNLGHEDTPMRYPFTDSMYAISKETAERQILIDNKEMDTIVVNPTFMLGAYDTKPSSGKIIMMAWKKKVVLYPPGGKNFVHVQDVAHGIHNALSKGKDGQRYILSNENMTFKEFYQKLNDLTKQNPLMIKIPKWLLTPIGYIGDMLRYMHIKTSLSSVNTKILCINNYYTNTKSISDLEIDYQSIDNAIVDAVDYFSKHST